jgi:hypothetical protein
MTIYDLNDEGSKVTDMYPLVAMDHRYLPLDAEVLIIFYHMKIPATDYSLRVAY